MEDRDFNEVELRTMLETATGYRDDIVDGRFVIETRHRRADWEIIVEPDEVAHSLVVITAYAVDRQPRPIPMRQRYLEVTFRNGKPLAAYLYLPRDGRARITSTRDAGHGMKVDFDASGTPVGVEITAPSIVSVASLNTVLMQLGIGAVAAEELRPLAA